MSKNITIEAFILCWNEEKILPHTINHYSQICDKITIIDNFSTDNSVKMILDAAHTSDTVLLVKQYDTQNQIRDDAYMHIKNTCWKNSTADFVIVCDMDELLYDTDLFETLRIAKISDIAIIPTQGYNMYCETFPDDYSKPITDQVKTGVRAYNFDKSIIFSPKLIKEINYSPGAHKCQPVFYKSPIFNNELNPIKLLHYKYLGQDYLLQKHTAYATRLSNYNKANNFGGEYLNGIQHIKNCFKQLKTSYQRIID